MIFFDNKMTEDSEHLVHNNNNNIVEENNKNIYQYFKPNVPYMAMPKNSTVVQYIANNNAKDQSDISVLYPIHSETSIYPQPTNLVNVGTTSTVVRTLDQINAYRQIETLHNYAKPTGSPKTSEGSCNSSSILDDDFDDEEDDEENSGDDDYDDEVIDIEKMETKYKKSRAKTAKILSVETLPKKMMIYSSMSSSYNSTPSPQSPPAEETGNNSLVVGGGLQDHHTRRPMNVFLIFCKRHREIVRDKHKSMENRAITKILGEWWALLDSSEKTPFNNLAKEYKDAFFSEHPNFKWHKLPAPPLRSLNTRPKPIIERESSFEEDTSADLQVLQPHHFELKRVEKPTNNTVSNFKFADETQMGGISRLLPSKEEAQPLFNGSKRKFTHTGDSSFSSSDDDFMVSQHKIGRTCKGKRYQEFKNSGQIITPNKKARLLKTAVELKSSKSGEASFECDVMGASPTKMEAPSFELHDRIKALPALSYDDYLQRKKLTKNKKIGLKKRHGGQNGVTVNAQDNVVKPEDVRLKAALAVKQTLQGSQKRKARKESIRRKVGENQSVILNITTEQVNEHVHGGIISIPAALSTTTDLDILAEVATNGDMFTKRETVIGN